MVVIKDKVLELIEKMPENSTIDDIMSELYFKIQVDTGLRELDQGKNVLHDSVKERLSKWTTK